MSGCGQLVQRFELLVLAAGSAADLLVQYVTDLLMPVLSHALPPLVLARLVLRLPAMAASEVFFIILFFGDTLILYICCFLVNIHIFRDDLSDIPG